MTPEAALSNHLTYAGLEARIQVWAGQRPDLALALVVGSRACLPILNGSPPEQLAPSVRLNAHAEALPKGSETQSRESHLPVTPDPYPERSEGQSKGIPLSAADEWSDLDLVLFTTNIQDYIKNGDWLEQFGECWITWLEHTGQGYPE